MGSSMFLQCIKFVKGKGYWFLKVSLVVFSFLVTSSTMRLNGDKAETLVPCDVAIKG